jgi:replicative DNA helicase
MAGKLEPLPYSTEAEQFVLGCILIDGVGGEELKPEDFYHPEHQEIFKAIQTVRSQNLPPDIVTVTDELTKNGKLDSIGGVTYVMDLTMQIPTTVNLSYYVKIVKDNSIKRQAILLGEKISETVLTGDLEEAKKLSSALSEITTGSKAKSLGEIMRETFTDENFQKIKDIKKWTSEPLEKLTQLVPFTVGENIYIAGRTGQGKTQMAITLGLSFAQQGAKVTYISLEIGIWQLIRRILNYELGEGLDRTGQSLARIDFQDKQWWEIGKQIAHNEKLLDNFYYTEDYFNLQDITDYIESNPFDVVFVDYIQNIQVGNGKTRNDELEYTAREFRRLSKKRCMVVLSQFNRESNKDDNDEDREIDLSRLRGSGGLEQSATSVILIRRDKDDWQQFYYAIAKNQTYGLGALTKGWKSVKLEPNGVMKEDF